LAELGLAPSTYYRWQRRHRREGEAGLVDRRPRPGTIWNRLRPEEQKTILNVPLREPLRSGSANAGQRLKKAQRQGIVFVDESELMADM